MKNPDEIQENFPENEEPVAETPEQKEMSDALKELAEKSEKELLWDQKRGEIDKITDKLGKGIEDDIKETVTAFNVYEIPTSQSCEGHLEEEGRGLPYPWVEVYAPEPKGWKESEGEERKELEKKWKEENMRQYDKIAEYLKEFYGESEKEATDEKLDFKNQGIFGAFRIQSTGAENMDSLSLEERKEKLMLYRAEMDRFTKSLKDKFFEQE